MVKPSLDLNWMVGGRVREVRLEGEGSWWFLFDNDGSIRADTLWRLIAAGRIHATSEDHGELFGLREPVDSAATAAVTLSTAAVQRGVVANDSGDLVLDFDNGSRLEIIATSAGYESWSVFFPNGDEAVSLGGGDIELRKP
jgi:hypothetical protein